MSICDYLTTFKGVNSISDDLLLNIIESNFKMYLDWCFLKIGAWSDTNIAYSGSIYGSANPYYKLLYTNDDNYVNGQVWQGIRKEWVWESGVSYNGNSPIKISGVYINGIFNPYSSGNLTIDYPLGRVIFDNPIASGSEVKANYSYRYVQTYRASDSPWFNIIQYSSLQTDNPDIVKSDDGSWSIGGNHRVQLPAIMIESLPRARQRPYEIGSNALIVDQALTFRILAENKNDRNKILDIIRNQQDATIALFDTNKIAQDNVFPLDANGDLIANPLMYPDLLCQYLWRKCWIKSVDFIEIDSINHNFHQGEARVMLEIISV
jgi:hypothetical protein